MSYNNCKCIIPNYVPIQADSQKAVYSDGQPSKPTWNPSQAATIGQSQAAQVQQTQMNCVMNAAPMANGASYTLPETVAQPVYTPGFLRQNIGSLVKVDFLIGACMTERVGILYEVGASYIVLKSLENSNKTMCDLYSIKFVTIMSQDVTEKQPGTYYNGEANDYFFVAASGR